MEKGDSSSSIPVRVATLRRHCMLLYRTWWAVHYSVGFIGVLAGGLAGVSAANEPARAWGWAVGALAAVCTSLVTFLGPLQKAERYWKAYHVIDQACLEYEHEHHQLSILIIQAKKVRTIVLGGAVTHEADSLDDLLRQKQPVA